MQHSASASLRASRAGDGEQDYMQTSFKRPFRRADHPPLDELRKSLAMNMTMRVGRRERHCGCWVHGASLQADPTVGRRHHRPQEAPDGSSVRAFRPTQGFLRRNVRGLSWESLTEKLFFGRKFMTRPHVGVSDDLMHLTHQ